MRYIRVTSYRPAELASRLAAGPGLTLRQLRLSRRNNDDPQEARSRGRGGWAAHSYSAIAERPVADLACRTARRDFPASAEIRKGCEPCRRRPLDQDRQSARRAGELVFWRA